MKSAALLRKAAEALDNGDDPFGGGFLADNDVTFDQCMSMAQLFAIGARLVAYGIENPRTAEGQAVFMSMARSPAPSTD